MQRKNGKKNFVRTLCFTLALCFAFPFSACAELFTGLVSNSSAVRPSTDEDTNFDESHSDKNSLEKEESDLETSGDTNTEDSNSGSDEEREETPLEPIVVPQAITEKYGYKQLGTYENEGLCAVYEQLYEQANAFFNSTQDLQPTDGGKLGVRYRLGAIEYAKEGLTLAQMTAVWKTFRSEYPEFYFLSNVYAYSDSTFYLEIYSQYAKYVNRYAVETRLKNLVKDCASYIGETATDEEKLIILHDFVAAQVDYAFKADGVTPSDEVWAHNLAGAALYGKGVCETYAETFDYLCDAFGLECLTVVGDAGEDGQWGPHAWNIIRLNEGAEESWHSVDITWDDAGSSEGFLLRKWLGVNAEDYENTHIADRPIEEWGVNWQAALPKLSEKPLSPVLLRENGEENEWCLSIDSAFEKMTNEDSRYEITLYPSTQIAKKHGLTVYPRWAEFTTEELPKAVQIKITGASVFVSETEYYPCEITAVNPLALGCETVLDGCTLYAEMSLANADRYLNCENDGAWKLYKKVE